MTKAAKPARSTGKRIPFAVELRGSLATARGLVVGDTDPTLSTQTFAYFALGAKDWADIEILTLDSDGEESNWIARADGTVLIPIGCAPFELDVTSLRRMLRKTAPLGKLLIAIQNGRKAVKNGNTPTSFVYTAEALVACANAATYLQWNIEDGELDTGRSVAFAEDVLMEEMLVVPGVVTDRALRTLARRTEAHYATKGTLLLGVLPWLQAQAAK